MVLTVLLWILGLGGSLLLLYLLTPEGTQIDHETRKFSGRERLFMLKAAAVLAALVTLMDVSGIAESTLAGRVTAGVLALPILFLLFMAAVGGVSSD